MSTCAIIQNGGAIPLASVPMVALGLFRRTVIEEVRGGARLAALCAAPNGGARARLLAVLADHGGGVLRVVSAAVGDSYPALTPECAQAHLFEREMAERFGIMPEGHPWLKPLRFSGRADAVRGGTRRPSADAPVPGVCDFYRVEGEEVHEVAVGPVHAGIIEPGHFRFQCHGETVMHLEIALGYQHRGVERALENGPDNRTIHYIETLAGDTTIAHATAHAELCEALGGCAAPPRAQALRAVALELERLANHTGDLGALANDVGFLPTASYCGRIRGDFLNMTALLCGNRFGRGLVVPGGVRVDIDEARAAELLGRLERATRDVTGAVELMWRSPSVTARFERTGVLPHEAAVTIGLVGPCARACGIERDVRVDFPTGAFRLARMAASTWHTGDVFARAHVRWREMLRSVEYINEQVRSLPEGATRSPAAQPGPSLLAVSLCEAWRGAVCHVAITDAAGRFARYKVVDPSFHNWFGLALAMRNQQISDFPLCNKSFNLSYCGHDL
ncbi:hydrogenase [bacterium]|nr:hydrogenase [bacterium]